MDQSLLEKVGEVVEQATSQAFKLSSFEPCHGGCIHQSGICSDGDRRFFVKVNGIEDEPMFAAEAAGLWALAKTGAMRVPMVIGVGVTDNHALLVLEALDLTSRASNWVQMGEGLARLHRVTGEAFGWDGDNYIGRTPQSNRRHEQWAKFFVEERLRFQFELAQSNGFAFEGWQKFLGRAEALLNDHQPQPSLLHGDLWSGNAAFTADGDPVIFDPACYHGDRECDVAFTEFFGGFPAGFYAAYRKVYPLGAGYETRRDLYNLYHVLNHANLFGGGYASQAAGMMSSITG